MPFFLGSPCNFRPSIVYQSVAVANFSLFTINFSLMPVGIFSKIGMAQGALLPSTVRYASKGWTLRSERIKVLPSTSIAVFLRRGLKACISLSTDVSCGVAWWVGSMPTICSQFMVPLCSVGQTLRMHCVCFLLWSRHLGVSSMSVAVVSPLL